uniref:BRCT domain-containing protein n=1 Tax=Angiostrongylus cantonensis TaxID=6313 RepID=A0A0K0DB13_ANGCA
QQFFISRFYNRNEDTPKSDVHSGRSSKDKSKISAEKESVGSKSADTPRRGKKDAIKKSDKSPRTVLKKEREEQRSHDPYDIETEMEKHPEPLKNIQMEVQSFGEVKYAKVGSGKYERTEKTAELRVSNLAEMTPRTKQRKSLAEFTPGRKKVSPVMAGNSTTRSRNSKQDAAEESMEVDKPTAQNSNQKRKTDTTRPRIQLPELSAEDLLAVDHPRDEHAPYEPGSRVYAIFDGLFYPAIVISRDGLGRFKVNFVEDDIIKDIPPSGVIPLRALDREKDCYFSDSDQKDPEFELEQLKDEEDWRDYINKKSREATDVITGTTFMLESVENCSTEFWVLCVKLGKITAKSSLLLSCDLHSMRTAPVSSVCKNMNAPGTGDEQIFAGKLFILTSANRPNTDTGFKKKFMTDFISTHGGLVEVDEHPNMERFLVSDTHYRTHKYLAALVRAMPCVSHEWIYKCLNEKKLVDYKPFLLPSGVSILDEKEYPLYVLFLESGIRSKVTTVFANFIQYFVEGKLDILLTDHSATASMVEKARKIGCAVVSSEWLIQVHAITGICLIANFASFTILSVII